MRRRPGPVGEWFGKHRGGHCGGAGSEWLEVQACAHMGHMWGDCAKQAHGKANMLAKRVWEWPSGDVRRLAGFVVEVEWVLIAVGAGCVTHSAIPSWHAPHPIPNWEAKSLRAGLVLRWVITREPPVLNVFFIYFCLHMFLLSSTNPIPSILCFQLLLLLTSYPYYHVSTSYHFI